MRTSLLFFLVFICGCKPDIPKDVLPPAKMQAVLWDVLQADELAEQYAHADSSFLKILKHARYYQAAFKVHRTTEETFKKSIRFYMEHPAFFKPILDSMEAAGNRRQKTDSLVNKKPKVILPDSVKRKAVLKSS